MKSYLSIGNLFVDGTLSTIYLPMSCVNDYCVVPWQIAEPEVGTIRFGVVPFDDQINYKSEDFDGWLYPDGSTYFLSDFALCAKISSLYGNDDEATFTMPTLSNFIRLNGIMQKSPELTSRVDGRNALMSHMHKIDVTATGTIQTYGTANYSNEVGQKDSIHKGTGLVGVKRMNSNGTYSEYTFPMEYINNSKYNNLDYVREFRKNHNLPAKVTKNNVAQFNAFVERYSIYHSQNIVLACSCDANVNNIEIHDSRYDDSETHPNYYDIPVMVYVGRRKR